MQDEQVVEQVGMGECFHPSSVKNDYGVTWWLPVPGDPEIPCDAAIAFGVGNQKLYVIRSLELVALRQTIVPAIFSDATFLDMLLVNDNAQDDCSPDRTDACSIAPGEANTLDDLVFYQVGATGKRGNTGQ